MGGLPVRNMKKLTAVERVNKKFTEELADAKLEDQIEGTFQLLEQKAEESGFPFPPHSIYIHSLYGTVASLTFANSTWRDKPCFLFQLEQLIRSLPAVSLSMDTQHSIFPSSFSGKEGMPIAPLYFDLKGAMDVESYARWITAIAGHLVQIKVRLPILSNAFIYRKRDSSGRVLGLGVNTRSQNFQTPYLRSHPNLSSIQKDERTLAMLESPIIWASGGSEYSNDVTYYFSSVGESNPSELAIIIANEYIKCSESTWRQEQK